VRNNLGRRAGAVDRRFGADGGGTTMSIHRPD